MANLDSHKITPFLWFNGNAMEAVDFYLSVFPNSKKVAGLSGQDGKALTITFNLEDMSFTAMNYPTNERFNMTVSFVVSCEDQAEIDYYWDKLSDGGKEMDCGWLTDRYGVFWQITPANIFNLVKHPAAMQAMLTMKKFDLARLEAAAREG